MLTRRHVLGTALTAAASLPFAPAARAADDWRAAFPEIVFATIPEENASGVTDRYAGFVDYLSKQLGVKVTLRIANDYAAIIEGQRAGNIHVAYYGPASFARALVTGVKTTAFAIDVNSDGTKGYYSVFYVKADSPYKTIEDLKGKAVGLVDPNSTSGYNMPLYTLSKMGIDPKSVLLQRADHRQPRERGHRLGGRTGREPAPISGRLRGIRTSPACSTRAC